MFNMTERAKLAAEKASIANDEDVSFKGCDLEYDPSHPAYYDRLVREMKPGEYLQIPEGMSLRVFGQRMAAAHERAARDNTKPTNPKDALGIGKVPSSVIPQPVLAEVGVGMLEGALKYGRHNYRVIGVRGSVYYDATRRHLDLWWEGEDEDPDSGLSHITKAITSLVVLRDAMIRENWNDDRPPATKPGWMNALNEKVKALLAKYPNPVAPYINGGKRG